MKTLITLALTFLLSATGFAQADFEKPADTILYLNNGNWDNYLKWNLSQQSASSALKSNYDGIKNNGISIFYNFPLDGGWFDMNISLSDTFTSDYPIVFYIRSSSPVNDNIELKYTDKDGSVFRRMIPLNNFTNKWSHIVFYLRDTEYAWGGDSKFDKYAWFSIAASGNAKDTIWLDEIGVGKRGIKSSFLSQYDPDSTLPGIGFDQRRDLKMNPEDLLVLEYLKGFQDKSSASADLLPSQEDDQAQTFNNSMVAIAFVTKNEKERAERILDYYSNATDKNNTDISLQNFYYNGEARGFYQWVSLKTRHAPAGAVDRWMGDMAWLLIACKNYEQQYNSNRYDELVKIIKDLLLSFYKESDHGGYIQSGWRKGDSFLHELSGHHEGNIDCYVALKLCGENYYAQKIKNWLEYQLKNQKNLPLDLYTWRVLAFGKDYAGLLNIPEFSYSYRKVIKVNGMPTMGFYNTPDFYTQNFWNDGTGHISCAFQAFGDKERGYFYANQLDHVIIKSINGVDTTHTIPYTLNKDGGYTWVDTTKGFVSCAAWYILAKNGINPYMSDNFKDTVLSVNESMYPNRIYQAFPNPFHEFLTIDFSLPSESTVKIEVYNILGRKIQTIFSKKLIPGDYSVSWNGKDPEGQNVSMGIYFLNLSIERQAVRTFKIIKTVHRPGQ